MKAQVQRKFRQVESWINDEADWQQVAADCRSILREIELEAVKQGHPEVVEIVQARGGGLRHTRKVLAACIEVLDKDSVKAAAKALGLSKETVYGLCERGIMPHTRSGRKITINQQQLEEYRRQHEAVKPKAQFLHLGRRPA